METALVTIAQAGLIPIVIALAGVVKNFKSFNTAYTPFVAIVLGILLSFVLSWMAPILLAQIILGGIVVGLSACGLYSATSSVKNELAG